MDSLDNEHRTPIFLAAQNGQNDSILFLLASRANINICDSNGFSPLMAASASGQTSTVKLLLQRRVCVDYGFISFN